MIAGMVAVGSFAEQPKPPKQPTMTLQERFDKMDANRNGILSQMEFIVAHKRMADQVAKSIFAKVGGGPDQPLTLDQVAKARTLWAKRVAPYQAEEASRTTTEEIFKSMDADENSQVSQAEFVAYWVKQAAERAEATFDRMGGSKDRGLVFAQFQKGAHARWEAARRQKEGTGVNR
jgi:Ca2+-binding EF-hand superfamily protein